MKINRLQEGKQIERRQIDCINANRQHKGKQTARRQID